MQQATDRLANPRLNLIEERLGRNLAAYVAEHRPDVSWRLIARHLAEETSVEITGEALRMWWGAQPTPEALVSRGAHS
jgi:hypothetical protein